MKTGKIKDFVLGGTLLGGLIIGGAAITKHSNKKAHGKEKPKTEVVKQTATLSMPKVTPNDPYGNVALFEASRSKIKFALAFVENYYPYIYSDGKYWTTGHGLRFLYGSNGKAKEVKQNTPIPTLEESDVFKGRYLTHEILPNIKNFITVPIDENTLIAACVLRYALGETKFRKSEFLKQLNAGKKGAELARYLTIYRIQDGVMKRCYFFAALMAEEIEFSDLLDLRSEGCYNLLPGDIAKWDSKKGDYVKDKANYAFWDFSKVHENLEKAKRPRTTNLYLGKGKGYVAVKCKLVKDIVPDYIWQELDAEETKKHKSIQSQHQSSISFANAITELRELALEKYHNQDYSGAIACLNDIIKTGYKNAPIYNDMSLIYYEAGQFKQAKMATDQALKYATTNKDKSAALYNQGRAYAGQGDYTRALESYSAASAFSNDKQIERAQHEAAAMLVLTGNKRQNKIPLLVALGVATAAIGAKKKRAPSAPEQNRRLI